MQPILSNPFTVKILITSHCDGNCVDGEGTMNYSNCERFEGDFENSKPTEGTYFLSNGLTVQGKWLNGQMDGTVIFNYHDDSTKVVTLVTERGTVINQVTELRCVGTIAKSKISFDFDHGLVLVDYNVHYWEGGDDHHYKRKKYFVDDIQVSQKVYDSRKKDLANPRRRLRELFRDRW